ncbi:unnamed protein product [Effrenium voratum]|nr:unnamed protein product [Effrenium voratum]
MQPWPALRGERFAKQKACHPGRAPFSVSITALCLRACQAKPCFTQRAACGTWAASRVRCRAGRSPWLEAQGLERLTAWLGDAEANLIMAVTSVGLPATIARELSVFHGAESVALRNRLYFPWRGEGRCPTVHGASSLLTVFALASGQDLAELRSAKDTHAAFADFVEQAARALRSVLPPYMVLCAESKDDPGANPPGRKISFTGQCRVGHRGAEQIALGDVDWALLKQALRGGVQRATGWVLEPRSAEAEVRVVAFFGDHHVALGVEVKEGETHQAPSILWSRLPRPGMQTNIAGAGDSGVPCSGWTNAGLSQYSSGCFATPGWMKVSKGIGVADF